MRGLLVLVGLLLLLPAVSAEWIMFVNCEDLLNKSAFTPQFFYNNSEPICFYGGGYGTGVTTIRLVNNETNTTREINVPAAYGGISSTHGYFFTVREDGNYYLEGNCNDQYICKNQDGFNFCEPGDISCTYTKFVESGADCIEDTSFTDLDFDGDGWTDSCDFFPLLGFEWSDIDLDRVGNNNDRSDFNVSSITVINSNLYSGPIFDESALLPEPSTPEQSAPAGASGGGGFPTGTLTEAPEPLDCVPEYECTFWGECIDGLQTRSCEIVNDCFDEVAVPITQQTCEVSQTVPPENVFVGAADEAQGAAGNANLITGAAVTEVPGQRNWILGGVIFVVFLLLAFVFYYRINKG